MLVVDWHVHALWRNFVSLLVSRLQPVRIWNVLDLVKKVLQLTITSPEWKEDL